MGGASSKTEIEGNKIGGDENKNENVGLLQITFEHVSGSFMTLLLIGLIVAIFLAVRWFRRRGGGSSVRRTRNSDLEAQWNNPDPGRAHRMNTEPESRIELANLPRLFLVSNATETTPSEQKQWSPSVSRLNSKTNPV